MNKIPYLIEDNTKSSLLNYINHHHEEINLLLENHGAILLRGFKIFSLSDFQRLSEKVCNELFIYKYGSSPRNKLGGNIYTSTEYPAEHFIPLHNENSYRTSWPKKILFCCMATPDSGGETPIANNFAVFDSLSKEIIEEFTRKKVIYVRNYGLGLDLTWQKSFDTEDKTEVETFCQSHEIEYEWLPGGILRTKQICQAVLQEEKTKKWGWFNQAHLFHESANPLDLKKYLLDTYQSIELPRNSFFGDGSHISSEYIQAINAAYEKVKIEFPWQKNDLLILDNEVYSHGRNSFTGPQRKIVVAMGN